MKTKDKLKQISIPIEEFEKTKFIPFDKSLLTSYYLVVMDLEIKSDYLKSVSTNMLIHHIIQKLNKKCLGKFHLQYSDKVFVWLENKTDETLLLLSEKIYI